MMNGMTMSNAQRVRDFHDALLVDGPLPLALLDHRMDAWIAAPKAK